MGAYNYKTVVHRDDFEKELAEWEKAHGECDGDPGYDGHYWLIVSDLLDTKDAEISALRAERGELLDALRTILPFVEEDFPAEGSPFPTTWAYGQAVLKVRATLKKAAP